jgi:hypothetical protein
VEEIEEENKEYERVNGEKRKHEKKRKKKMKEEEREQEEVRESMKAGKGKSVLAGHLLSLFFDPEDGGSIFLRNDYVSLH